MRKRHGELFATAPNLHAEISSRIPSVRTSSTRSGSAACRAATFTPSRSTGWMRKAWSN